jgi:hypothetical protein
LRSGRRSPAAIFRRRYPRWENAELPSRRHPRRLFDGLRIRVVLQDTRRNHREVGSANIDANASVQNAQRGARPGSSNGGGRVGPLPRPYTRRHQTSQRPASRFWRSPQEHWLISYERKKRRRN